MANVPAAAQALEVLSLLARHTQPLPAGSIARELGLPRSSTYHLLSVLRDHGFVTHLVEERRYGLGVAAYELGSAYQRQAPLQRIARPLLQRLVDETTHNAHLAVLHGRDVLYVIEERAPGRPLLVTDVGVRLPATLTASGLAMLAALPPAQVRALFPHRDRWSSAMAGARPRRASCAASSPRCASAGTPWRTAPSVRGCRRWAGRCWTTPDTPSRASPSPIPRPSWMSPNATASWQP